MCGNTIISHATDLKSRHTRSCGCISDARRRNRCIDLTDKIFGRLTVICRAPNETRRVYWVCQCSCGQKATVPAVSLRRQNGTQSCGCLKHEAKKHGHGRRTGKSPEYITWQSMIDRTTNPMRKAYKHYGGRGIAFDLRWESFENFIADMGLRPSPQHSLERLNNDLGYSKDNCIWALRSQQMRNTRRTKYVVLNGETMCLLDACLKAGVPLRSVNATRFFKGLDHQAAFDYHLNRRTS